MKLFAIAPMVLACAALIAGCGGSSGSSTTKTSSAALSSSSSSSAAPVFASAANCLQLAGVGDKFEQAITAATSGKTINLNQAVTAYQNLANAAPAAIKTYLEGIAHAFDSFTSALEKANYKVGSIPSASQIAALTSAGKAFQSSAVKQDAHNLANWAKQNCSA
jgi:hypothetical protein